MTRLPHNPPFSTRLHSSNNYNTNCTTQDKLHDSCGRRDQAEAIILLREASEQSWSASSVPPSSTMSSPMPWVQRRQKTLGEARPPTMGTPPGKSSHPSMSYTAPLPTPLACTRWQHMCLLVANGWPDKLADLWGSYSIAQSRPYTDQTGVGSPDGKRQGAEWPSGQWRGGSSTTRPWAREWS